MISGSLSILSEAADEPLENYHDSGQRAIEVSSTQNSLDGANKVQTGKVAGKVNTQRRVVSLDGYRIQSETRKTSSLTMSEWVADVESGWIVAESTHPTEEDFKPPWPFTTFSRVLSREVFPVFVDPGEFAKRQQDNSRDTATEMVSRGSGDGNVSIDWGREAKTAEAPQADIGVALTTLWNGEFVRVVVYESGYLACWEPQDWAPSAFARFVDEEVLPVAYVPEDDDSQQTTLEEGY